VTVWTQNRIIRRKTRTCFSTIRSRVTLNTVVIHNTFVTPALLMPKNSNLYCHCSLLKITNAEECFTIPFSLFQLRTTWKQLSVSDLTLSLYFLVTRLHCHWNLHSSPLPLRWSSSNLNSCVPLLSYIWYPHLIVFTRNYEALLAYNHTSVQALFVSLHHKQYPICLLASSCLILTFVQCTGIRLATAYYGGRNLRHVGATWPLVVVWRSPAIGWPAFRLPTSATYFHYVCTHSFMVYVLYTWVWAVSTCFYHTKNFNKDVDT